MSKGFCKSTEAPHTISSLSGDILMVSIKLISACSVEWFEQKPNWFVFVYLQKKNKSNDTELFHRFY